MVLIFSNRPTIKTTNFFLFSINYLFIFMFRDINFSFRYYFKLFFFFIVQSKFNILKKNKTNFLFFLKKNSV
jgi:hypothetical protein